MTKNWARLKHVAEINRESLPDNTDPQLKIRYIDISSVGQGRLVAEPAAVTFSDAPARARRLVAQGDTIVSTVRTYLRAVWPVQGSTDDLVVSTGFAVVSPHSVVPRYLAWYLQTDTFLDQVTARSVGVSYPAIDAGSIGDIGIVIPSEAEQRQIAHLLDSETFRLDALIARKRRLIELLRERWQAELTASLYDFNPAQSSSLRHVIDILPGYAFPSSEFTDQGVRLLRGANIAPGELRWDREVVYLDPDRQTYPQEFELAEGDVVLGMDRPMIESGLRIATVAASDLPCLLVQRVARIRSTEYSDLKYIRLLLDSDAFVAHLSPAVTGVSVPHISADQILAFRAPIPKLETQRTIANKLNKKLGKNSTLRDRLKAQIALLVERRQALVTAVMTGDSPIPRSPV